MEVYCFLTHFEVPYFNITGRGYKPHAANVQGFGLWCWAFGVRGLGLRRGRVVQLGFVEKMFFMLPYYPLPYYP